MLDDRFVIGIDPGIKGAIAVLDYNGNYEALYQIPVMLKGKGKSTVKNQISAPGLSAILSRYTDCRCVMERVSAMPGQGVSSMFSLGDSYGCIRGVLAAWHIAVEIITPQTWKKFYKITGERNVQKEIARAKAIELFPQAELHLKKHADRAEALLMANWGVRNACN